MATNGIGDERYDDRPMKVVMNKKKRKITKMRRQRKKKKDEEHDWKKKNLKRGLLVEDKATDIPESFNDNRKNKIFKLSIFFIYLCRYACIYLYIYLFIYLIYLSI